MYSFPVNYIFNAMENLNFEFIPIGNLQNSLDYFVNTIPIKWSDNMQNENNQPDRYINGDVTFDGRLNYVYKTK